MPIRRWRTRGLVGGLLALTLSAVAACGTVPEQAVPERAPDSRASDQPTMQGPQAPKPSPTSEQSTAEAEKNTQPAKQKQSAEKTQSAQDKESERARKAEEKQARAAEKAQQKAEQEKARKDAEQARQQAILAQGDEGEKVRELQHRLQQLDWFQGKITGNYGTVTTTSVNGFQGKRDLAATGLVDQKTWDALVDMTSKPTHNEMHNKLVAGKALWKEGSDGDKVKELQARLKQSGWFSEKITGHYGPVTTAAVKGFQGKREIPETGEVDQRTWDRLTGMTRQPTKDELANKVAKQKADDSTAGLDERCLTGRAMCISKSNNQLVWVIDGKVQNRFDVRFGSSETPTREGAFSVGWKARDWTSTLYHSKMPYAMFFSGGQAVHYSSDFAARGYNGASHGCVNVRDLAGIQALFDAAQVGDKVIVYR